MILATHSSHKQAQQVFKRIDSLESFLFYLLFFFLPTQLGKHFWPSFSFVQGIRVDYLSPTIYFTDVLTTLLFVTYFFRAVFSCIYRPHPNPILKEEGMKKNKGQENYLPPLLKRVREISGFWIFLLFTMFLIVNILVSGSILNDTYHLIKFLEFSFVAYYIAITAIKQGRLRMIIFCISLGMIGESFLAIVQYFHHGSLGGPLYFLGERTFTSQTPGIANASVNGQLVLRPYATFSHPNVLAGYLVLCMTFIMFTSMSNVKLISKRAVTILLWLSLVIGTIALLLTLSRAAILLWGTILCIFTIVFTLTATLSPRDIFLLPLFLRGKVKRVRKRKDFRVQDILLKRQNFSALLFVFVGLVLFIFFFSTPLLARFTQTSLTEESLAQRGILINASWQMIDRNPFVGIGLGNFLPVLSIIQKPLSLGLYLQPVHNIFLLIFAETGVIGLGFSLWFLAKTYNHLFLSIRQAETQNLTSLQLYIAMLIMLTEVLILGFFDHYFLTLQQGQLLFSFVIGLSWACRYEAE